MTYAVYAYWWEEKKVLGMKYKGITVAQWDNRLQNGSFVNRTQ